MKKEDQEEKLSNKTTGNLKKGDSEPHPQKSDVAS